MDPGLTFGKGGKTTKNLQNRGISGGLEEFAYRYHGAPHPRDTDGPYGDGWQECDESPELDPGEGFSVPRPRTRSMGEPPGVWFAQAQAPTEGSSLHSFFACNRAVRW